MHLQLAGNLLDILHSAHAVASVMHQAKRSYMTVVGFIVCNGTAVYYSLRATRRTR